MAPHDEIQRRVGRVLAGSERQREESGSLRSEFRIQRDDMAAVRAQSDQVRTKAQTLRAQSNAILDSAERIAAMELAQQRIALAKPVTARFQTDAAGNTGIELTVELEDPSRADAAREAITERFGGESDCDNLIVG